MTKTLNILRTLLELAAVLAFLFLSGAQYFYPDLLEFISYGLLQLIIMSLGAFCIVFISLRNISLPWKIFAIIVALLIIAETFVMGHYV